MEYVITRVCGVYDECMYSEYVCAVCMSMCVCMCVCLYVCVCMCVCVCVCVMRLFCVCDVACAARICGKKKCT